MSCLRQLQMNWKWLAAAGLTAGLGFFAGPAALAQSANQVCVFADLDYGGTKSCTSLANVVAGGSPLGVATASFGISSIGLPRGYYVVAYSGPNYTGASLPIYGSISDLRPVGFQITFATLNDSVGSYKVFVDEDPNQYSTCLYSGRTFTGTRTCYAPLKPGGSSFTDLPSVGFPSGLVSISFPRDVRVTLFRDRTTVGNGGGSYRLADDVSDLYETDFPLLSGEFFAPYLAEAQSIKIESLYLRELLTNGDGSLAGMTGWNWSLEQFENELPDRGWENSAGEFKTQPFQWTSTRFQDIDLLSFGITSAVLAQQPILLMSERVRAAFCTDSYLIRVELRDSAQRVLAFKDTGWKTVNGSCAAERGPWTLEQFRFQDYPIGARYIRWYEVGRSSEHRDGPVFDNASVMVLPVTETPHLDNLVTNPRGAGGTIGWTSSGVASFQALDSDTANPTFFLKFGRTDTGGVAQKIDLWAAGLDPVALVQTGLGIAFEYQSCTLKPKLTVTFFDQTHSSLGNSVLTASSVGCVTPFALGHNFSDLPPGVRFVELSIGAAQPPQPPALAENFDFWGVTLLALGENLVTNPNGDSGLSGWTTTGTWGTTTRSRIRSDEPVFVATDSVTRTQTIDLLALGYNPMVLDDGPTILVSEEHAGEASTGILTLQIELLDENDAQIGGNTLVITPTTSWAQLENGFEGIDTQGVRKVRWTETWVPATPQQKVYLDGAFVTLIDELSDFRPEAPRQSRVTRGAGHCGNPGQKACTYTNYLEEGVCVLASLFSQSTSLRSCPDQAEVSYCNEGAKLKGGWCYSEAIDCCTAVSYVDSSKVTRHPAGSYTGRIHLGGVETVVEKREPALCPRPDNPGYFNPVKSILKNNYDMGSLVGAWWGDQYGDLPLMITANYFQVRMDSLHPYTNPCTNNLGYTVSDGALVADANGQAHGTELETLIFFTAAEAKARGYYAEIVLKADLPKYAGKIQDAVSGHQLLFRKSYVTQPDDIDPGIRLPRCAVGLDKAKRELIVVAVNNGDNRDGIKLPDLANYLRAQGAYDALNLDGSGSCQLWFHEGVKDYRTLPSDVIDNVLPADRQNLLNVKFFRPVPGFLGFRQRLDGHGPVHDEN